MKVAIIGFGKRGQAHAAAYKHMTNIHVTSVCDLDTDALRNARRMGLSGYTCLDELIKHEQPDVISVCLPLQLREAVCKEAADAGVHVIVEGSLSDTVTKAEETLDYCTNKGVRLLNSLQIRSSPYHIDMIQQVRDGAIGQVGVINGKRVVEFPSRNRTVSRAVERKHILFDLLYSEVDFVRLLMDKVVRVYALHRTSEQVECVFVTLKGENGMIVNLTGVWSLPNSYEEFYELAGRSGTIRHKSEQVNAVRIHSKSRAQWALSPIQDPCLKQLESLISCIQTGSEPAVSQSDNLQTLRLVEMAQQSIESGLPVFFPENEKKGEGTYA